MAGDVGAGHQHNERTRRFSMKGLIFNVVSEVVEAEFGVDAWDEVIERAGVEGAYTSLGNYPDAELVALARAAAEVAHVTMTEALVLIGRKGFALLAGRHVELLDNAASWRAVLQQLDGIIHPEVKKIYPDADVPSFDADDRDGAVILEYSSERNLCSLAEGLVLGLGDWYGSDLSVRHRSCIHHGDSSCVLEVREP